MPAVYPIPSTPPPLFLRSVHPIIHCKTILYSERYYLRKSVDCAWFGFLTIYICTTITRDYTLLYVFIMIYVGVCAMKSKQPTQWNLSCNQNWSMFYQWSTNPSKFLKRRENPTSVMILGRGRIHLV